MVDFAVNPRTLALINVDLQNAFVEGTPVSAPDGPAVVARVNKLAAACRRAGVLVIQHRPRHAARRLERRRDGRDHPPVREGMIAKGSFTAALHKDLKIEPPTSCSKNRASAPSTAPTWSSSCACAASTA
jgi:nicotinamidase-related amidase